MTKLNVVLLLSTSVAECEARVEHALRKLDASAGELHAAYLALRLAREALANETAMRVAAVKRGGIAAHIKDPGVMFGIDNSAEAQKHHDDIDLGLAGICSECGKRFATNADVERAHRDAWMDGSHTCWYGRGSAYSTGGCKNKKATP